MVDYSPATAAALAGGSTDGGWVNDPGNQPPWDNILRSWNLRVIEQRSDYMQVVMRDAMAAQRRLTRMAAGIIPVPLSLLGIGDSITDGGLSADGTGYRGWAVDALDQRYIAATFPRVACPTLVTLRSITPLVPAALAATQPDIVVLAVGTNDGGDLTDWQARHLALVDTILASSPTVKVMCARMMTSAAHTGLTHQPTVAGYVDATVTARQGTGRVIEVRWDLPLPSPNPDQSPWTWTFDGTHPVEALYAHMARKTVWTAADAGWLPA